ncbi:hypothetical protein BFW01_g12879 [Lasiodiplodia theobromae]|nr:hypothetical protein BFW01_g12879 [Lasiodiplodia theobromae]
MPSLLGSIRPILHAGVVAQIRNWHISVRLDADPYFNAAEVTAAFSNADSLEVECWQAQFEACDYSVLRLFQDVRGIGRAKVSGSVGYGFAHWLELVMESPKEMEEEMETGFSTPGLIAFTLPMMVMAAPEDPISVRQDAFASSEYAIPSTGEVLISIGIAISTGNIAAFPASVGVSVPTVVHVVYFVLNAKVDDSPEDSAYLTVRF